MIPAPIPHSAGCRRPTPHTRLSWRGDPELFCPGCGRACPAPDTRTTTAPEEPHAC